MIRCGDAPSNQGQLELPGLDGLDLMEDARKWAVSHIAEWSWYKRFALQQCADGSKASPNFVLQSMRNEFHCEVRNALAPCFARIAMEQDPRLRFRLAKSKVDGFTKAKL